MLRDHIAKLDNADLYDDFLLASYKRQIDALDKSSERLNDESLKFPQQACAIWLARAYMASVKEFYPMFQTRLMQHLISNFGNSK